MVEHHLQKHCGVALSTILGMQMFAIRCSRKHDVVMLSPAPTQEHPARQGWIFAYNNFPKYKYCITHSFIPLKGSRI
jgi:hypothetical protein